MSTITLTLNLNEVSESALAEALRILKGGSTPAEPVKKPKAEIPAPVEPAKKQKAETPAPAAPAAEEVKQEETKTTEKKVTIEEIRAVVNVKKSTKREEIKALLTKFEADSVSTLKPEKYLAFFTELEAL